jgi:CheY-like chemotaxis protein/HPt (histidine-containing phosphotransfer) domain-containing protein
VAQEQPADRLETALERLRGMTVLVVDDNRTNCRILQDVLGAWGMRPTCVATALEAEALLAQAQTSGNPFPLVITDAHMPQTDGFSLAERIRGAPELGGAVIMMLTSGDQPGDIARCQQLGINAYLLKPIKQSELIEAILVAVDGEAGQVDTAAVEAKHAFATMAPLNILLAEDSLVNQKLARALLAKAGHQVVVADNGREAMAAFESQSFDLILMDVQMPEMDGLEATTAIRAVERRQGGSVPIIAMTAHVLPGDRERCLDAGMNGYIAKPVRAQQLYAAILRAVPSGSSTEDTAADCAAPREQLDWQQALAAAQGDKRLLDEMVAAAMTETAEQWRALREALAAGDAKGVRTAAHTLKGSIRYFGQTAAYRHALRIEEMAREGLPEGTDFWTEKLGRSLESLRCELAQCVIK